MTAADQGTAPIPSDDIVSAAKMAEIIRDEHVSVTADGATLDVISVAKLIRDRDALIAARARAEAGRAVREFADRIDAPAGRAVSRRFMSEELAKMAERIAAEPRPERAEAAERRVQELERTVIELMARNSAMAMAADRANRKVGDLEHTVAVLSSEDPLASKIMVIADYYQRSMREAIGKIVDLQRERDALREAAQKIIDDHHPSGDPVPSSVHMDGSAALYPSVRIRGEHWIALRDALAAGGIRAEERPDADAAQMALEQQIAALRGVLAEFCGAFERDPDAEPYETARLSGPVENGLIDDARAALAQGQFDEATWVRMDGAAAADCLRCGARGDFTSVIGAPVDVYLSVLREFDRQHAQCPPTKAPAE